MVMQRSGRFQWRIWDPGTFCSVGGEHQLERRLVQALLEDKQFLLDEDATGENEKILQHHHFSCLRTSNILPGETVIFLISNN